MSLAGGGYIETYSYSEPIKEHTRLDLLVSPAAIVLCVVGIISPLQKLSTAYFRNTS